MQLEASIPIGGPQKGPASELTDVFAEVFGIDRDSPCVSKYFDPMLEEEEVMVTDTDGNEVGVIDLTQGWIRFTGH